MDIKRKKRRRRKREDQTGTKRDVNKAPCDAIFENIFLFSSSLTEMTQEQRYKDQLQEPQWETLSGKSIDMQKLLRWGLSNATRNEDAQQPASSAARSHEPIVRSILLCIKSLNNCTCRTQNGSMSCWAKVTCFA